VITQPKVVRLGVNRHPQRPADLIGGLLRSGKIAAADQQRNIGVDGAQGPRGMLTDGAGAAHEENWIKGHCVISLCFG
jgi:hypothetical protein